MTRSSYGSVRLLPAVRTTRSGAMHEADELLKLNETDPDDQPVARTRKPVLEEFFQIWTDEVPVIPLFSNTRVYVVRNGFENWKAGPTSTAPDAWNAWEWALTK